MLKQGTLVRVDSELIRSIDNGLKIRMLNEIPKPYRRRRSTVNDAGEGGDSDYNGGFQCIAKIENEVRKVEVIDPSSVTNVFGPYAGHLVTGYPVPKKTITLPSGQNGNIWFHWKGYGSSVTWNAEIVFHPDNYPIITDNASRNYHLLASVVNTAEDFQVVQQWKDGMMPLPAKEAWDQLLHIDTTITNGTTVQFRAKGYIDIGYFLRSTQPIIPYNSFNETLTIPGGTVETGDKIYVYVEYLRDSPYTKPRILVTRNPIHRQYSGITEECRNFEYYELAEITKTETGYYIEERYNNTESGYDNVIEVDNTRAKNPFFNLRFLTEITESEGSYEGGTVHIITEQATGVVAGGIVEGADYSLAGTLSIGNEFAYIDTEEFSLPMGNTSYYVFCRYVPSSGGYATGITNTVPSDNRTWYRRVGYVSGGSYACDNLEKTIEVTGRWLSAY